MLNPGNCDRAICRTRCIDVRTQQHSSARLSRQQELKSASYVNASLLEWKMEIIINVERRDVENKTSVDCQ